MIKEDPAQSPPPQPPYPAEKARGGEIVLKKKSQRALFILGLALGMLIAVLVALTAI